MCGVSFWGGAGVKKLWVSNVLCRSMCLLWACSESNLAEFASEQPLVPSARRQVCAGCTCMCLGIKVYLERAGVAKTGMSGVCRVL